MPIPRRAVLVEQIHCLSDDGAVVITAQRWSDPAATDLRPVTWLRLVRNGCVRAEHQFAGVQRAAEMERFWAGRVEDFAATALTDDQMWEKLRELAGIEQAVCGGTKCAGRLASGAAFCPVCGRSPARVAAGSMLTARGRGTIVLDLRGRREND